MITVNNNNHFRLYSKDVMTNQSNTTIFRFLNLHFFPPLFFSPAPPIDPFCEAFALSSFSACQSQQNGEKKCHFNQKLPIRKGSKNLDNRKTSHLFLLFLLLKKSLIILQIRKQITISKNENKQVQEDNVNSQAPAHYDTEEQEQTGTERLCKLQAPNSATQLLRQVISIQLIFIAP